MYLRMTLDRAIQGFWDGGPRAVFDYHIDGPRGRMPKAVTSKSAP